MKLPRQQEQVSKAYLGHHEIWLLVGQGWRWGWGGGAGVEGQKWPVVMRIMEASGAQRSSGSTYNLKAVVRQAIWRTECNTLERVIGAELAGTDLIQLEDDQEFRLRPQSGKTYT